MISNKEVVEEINTNLKVRIHNLTEYSHSLKDSMNKFFLTFKQSKERKYLKFLLPKLEEFNKDMDNQLKDFLQKAEDEFLSKDNKKGGTK